jgi:hypothetical protein
MRTVAARTNDLLVRIVLVSFFYAQALAGRVSRQVVTDALFPPALGPSLSPPTAR